MPKHQVFSTSYLPRSRGLLINIIGAVMTISLSLMLCYFIGERFFFDKLFYKKSALHGYYNQHYAVSSRQLHSLLQVAVARREKDLRDLLTGKFWTKNPNVKTVAVIGDSYTYGVGVTQSERFSEHLGPELKKLGITAEVYVFADPGNSLLDYLTLYQKVQNQLNPDLVIIGIVSNDLFFNFHRYPGNVINARMLDLTCSQPMYISNIDMTKDDGAFFKAAIDSFDPQWRNYCYLDEIAQIFGKNPKLMYFNFSPKITNIACHKWDGSLETKIMNQYISRLEAHGIRGLSHLSKNPAKTDYVSQKENHPSRRLHREFAKEIAQFAADYLR